MANTALKLPTTFDEFMEWEPRQPERWEFMEGRPRLMAGAALRHNLVVMNLAASLFNHLRGTPCRVVTADMKVKVPGGRVAYPDIVVLCSRRSGDDIIIDDPVVLIEVLSPSTEKYDRSVKQPAYETIPSLRHIVLVSRDEPKLDLWSRGDDGTWHSLVLEGLTATLRLDALAIDLPLAEIYDRIEFDDTRPGSA